MVNRAAKLIKMKLNATELLQQSDMMNAYFIRMNALK